MSDTPTTSAEDRDEYGVPREYEVTAQTIRETLKDVDEDRLRSLREFCRVWRNETRERQEGDWWRFFAFLDRIVSEELKERAHGLWSLRDDDLMRLLCGVLTIREAAGNPSTPTSHYGTPGFWGTATMFVDQEKRRMDIPMLRCTGPHGPGECPILHGQPCGLINRADGILFQLDLDREDHRQILRLYVETLDVPIRVVVPEDQQERYASNLLLGPVLGTQAVATLIAVYGVLIPPIGWGWAAVVWAYALVCFLINDQVKLLTHWVLDRRDAQADLPQDSSPLPTAVATSRT